MRRERLKGQRSFHSLPKIINRKEVEERIFKDIKTAIMTGRLFKRLFCK
ncbi:MAG: hypothetical protein OXJ52_00620 [Oligoflexia bacterium]|nr:hypothetical protein [Oligoflexia bacterium]